MDKVKILQVLDTYYPVIDGPVSVIKSYTIHLNSSELCEIAVPKASKKSGYVDKETFKVNRCRSFTAPEGYRLGIPFTDRKFRKTLKNNSYDIIHVHSPFAMGRYGVKLAKKKKIPVVATLHTKYYDDFLRSTKSKLLSKIALKYAMWVYNHADYVWTVSPGAKEVLREYGYKGEITIVNNGTDFTYPENAQELIDKINELHNLEGQKNVFIFIGRMAMYKNLKLLCDGLKVLKDSGEDFKMLFVGGGFDLDQLKDYAKEQGIYDNCIFTGNVSDRTLVQAYYLRSDMMLFPSTFDTASVTRFEAAAHKKAVLFIEGCNSAEGIIDNQNGFLSKEDGQSYGQKLIEITSKGSDYIKQIGENAYREVYRSWKDVTVDVLAKYKNCIQEYNSKKSK